LRECKAKEALRRKAPQAAAVLRELITERARAVSAEEGKVQAKLA
jgi:hypothetical protein